MDLQNLSTNWKQLRQQLTPNPSNGIKRKSLAELPQSQSKRPRPNLTSHTKRSYGMNVEPASAAAHLPPSSLTLWAKDNDINPKDIAAAYGSSTDLDPSLHPTNLRHPTDNVNGGLSPNIDPSAGKYIAIDCEMVGVGPDPDHDSALARVSIVNYHGTQIYDSFVQTKEAVTDYRTAVSGITPRLLNQARPLEQVQQDVAAVMQDKILIGHAVQNDLAALLLSHPRRDIRDTSKYPPFRLLAGKKTPGLKRLAKELLGLDIQGGEHSSIEDARATMLLFRREKDGFEREHRSKWGQDRAVASAPGQGMSETNETKAKKKKKKPKRKR